MAATSGKYRTLGKQRIFPAQEKSDSTLRSAVASDRFFQPPFKDQEIGHISGSPYIPCLAKLLSNRTIEVKRRS